MGTHGVDRSGGAGGSGATQNYTPVTDVFDGDSTTVAFTLTVAPGSASALVARVSGVVQTPGVDFTVSSNVITFTTAPASGTDNIVVQNFGVAWSVATVAGSAITGLTSDLVTFDQSGTGAVAEAVQAALRRFAFPEQYGAVGDGVTDDTAALTRWAAAHDNLALMAGKTYLTDGITITSVGKTIYGMTGNSKAVIKVSGNSGSFGIKLIHANGNGTHFTSKFSGRNFDITCAVSANKIYGIWCDNADYTLLDHVNIDLTNNTHAGSVRNSTFALHGYFLQDSVNLKCAFASGTGANADGVFLTGVLSSASPNNNLFLGCRAQSCGGWGVRNSLGDGNIWLGGKIQSNTSGGWLESDDGLGNGPSNTVIQGAGFEVNTGDDFKCDVANHSILRDNTFQSTGATNHINVVFMVNGVFDSNFSFAAKPVVIAGGSNNRWARNNVAFGTRTFTAGTVQDEDPIVTPTYDASIALDASEGSVFHITATDTSAFTIVNPTNPSLSQFITFLITNSSGGAMGAITWDTDFKLAGPFTNPANTKRRTITFYYASASIGWVEVNRAAADIS